MKERAKAVLDHLIKASFALFWGTRIGRYLFAGVAALELKRTQEVEHRGLALTLCTPNGTTRFRADTFATKEPETLDWIDSFPEGSVVWDIGANVGLYSCYAAKRRGCRVYAFEPSVFNLEWLARNIFLNQLTHLITIVPLPLSDARAVSTLNMTNTEWGGALSTFGHSFGHDGGPLEKVFEFRTIGMSMVDAVELLEVEAPDYVKLDVDGIEHLVLAGGMPVLRSVEGVLVEISERFAAQARQARAHLREAGLSPKCRQQPEPHQDTCNEIWARSLDTHAVPAVTDEGRGSS